MNIKKVVLIFIGSILLLLFIFWPSSPTSNPIQVTPPASPTPRPKFEVTLPSKGLLKNYVTVSVKAETGTSCNLIFIPASGDMLDMDTIANEKGECIWRWKLEESYKKGTARLIFTINGISDTRFLQILENF
jgi:hypothetical protein